MKAVAFLLGVAILSVAGKSTQAAGHEDLEIVRASLRTRMVSVMYFPEDHGPPRIPQADVTIRGRLPEGSALDLDPSAAPLPVEVTLNGVTVLGGPDGPISIAPAGPGGRWAPASSVHPDVSIEYARWLRVVVDTDRGTFHIRTRYVDHAVMEGEPGAVPYLVRIGDREFSGTLDFRVVGSRLWSSRLREPGRMRLDGGR